MGSVPQAVSMLETVSESNVFSFDTRHRLEFRLAMLSIALYDGNSKLVYDSLRWFTGTKPTSGAIYKLIGSIINRGLKYSYQFSLAISLKFFRRQINILFDIISKDKELKEIFSRKDLLNNDKYPILLDRERSTSDYLQKVKAESKNLDDFLWEKYLDIKEYNFDLIGIISQNQYKVSLADVKSMFVLLGHLAVSSRTYKSAISMYLTALSLDPEDSSLCLALSSVYLIDSVNKRDTTRHRKVSISLHFIFKYAKLREKELLETSGYSTGDNDDVANINASSKETSNPFPGIRIPQFQIPREESDRIFVYQGSNSDQGIDIASWVKSQEVAYNLARSFHGLRILYLAIPYYERVLELHEIKTENIEASDGNYESLQQGPYTRQAAYNLSQIYASSGSFGLAQILYLKYLVI
ncbi:General transcription factor 3C polypeptide 3 [Smittium mucronatum]|uniref:General transcription factor 3C polypeptide 3 n=1 Tax=Smittium mucronatum TaxID=133383 RepID=A0A1R0H022_9FUNG|nr:General transcription factor 3C polypeptide 3 [Smittium mucronatum]